jgi:hypothetical protein
VGTRLAVRVDDEHSGGMAGELDEVEGEDCNRREFGGMGNLKEVDYAGHISCGVDTGEDSEFGVRLLSLYSPQPVLLQTLYVLVDGRHDGGDHNCRCHHSNHHHYELLVVQNLHIYIYIYI